MSAAAGLEVYLERIALREEEVRAFAWFDAERARRRAREIEDGVPAGAPLRGVPVAIKDVIDVAGLPTGMGSPLYDGNVPQESADLVVRLERAGALILGKAVTAELAFLSPGPTRNPHDPAHTPGGSSSVSAAAVAAGFAPLAVGTQTNGSIIRPAAFCGVVGFKPSRGRVSTRGVLSWSPTLDQPGVFASNVGEARRAFAVLDAQANVECSILNVECRLQPELKTQNSTFNIRAVRSPVWERADDAQRHHPAQLSAEIHRLVDDGSKVSEQEYAEALALRLDLQRQLERSLDGFDVIVTPPACGEAPLGIASTGDPSFCTIWSLCGGPALGLPVAHGPRGLPLGLQLVGRFDHDEELLASAEWCESALAPFLIRPAPDPRSPTP